jgi:hypothetical protein
MRKRAASQTDLYEPREDEEVSAEESAEFEREV